jgi:hypothetical protein
MPLIQDGSLFPKESERTARSNCADSLTIIQVFEGLLKVLILRRFSKVPKLAAYDTV